MAKRVKGNEMLRTPPLKVTREMGCVVKLCIARLKNGHNNTED